MAKIDRILSKILMALVYGYRWLISPLLGNRCRFYPSCSEYALTALEKQGLFRGSWLILKRVICCQPFHPGGFDPVPQRPLLKPSTIHVCPEGK